MENEEFKKLLKKAGLTKKEFAGLVGTSSEVVNNWNTKNREIPYWVKSWVELCIGSNNGTKLKDLLREHVCKEKKMGSLVMTS